MEKVYGIKVEPMTEESFEPFGMLIDPQERPPDRRMIIPLDFHAEGRGGTWTDGVPAGKRL